MTAVTPSQGTDRPGDAAAAASTPAEPPAEPAERRAEPPDPPRLGDLVITLVLLVVFGAGYLAARDWPLEAALFPQLLSAAGVLLAVLKLIGIGMAHRQVRRAGRPGGETAPGPGGGTAPGPDSRRVESEDEADDQSIEYVFGTASGREWAAALAWGLGFFALLWIVGVFITVPVFCFAYLRFAGRTSWLAASVYAAVA
ncbi:MAG: hypothetical protein ACRDT1_17670, partial [Micromonosporaceae bacterium]